MTKFLSCVMTNFMTAPRQFVTCVLDSRKLTVLSMTIISFQFLN